MKAYENIEELNGNHSYERVYGPVAFDARAKESSVEAALTFLKANGLLESEKGVIFYFEDGPLNKAVEVDDVCEFVTNMTKAAWANENHQPEAEDIMAKFLSNEEIANLLFHDVPAGYEISRGAEFIVFSLGMVDDFFVIPESKLVNLLSCPDIFDDGVWNYNTLGYAVLKYAKERKPEALRAAEEAVADSDEKYPKGYFRELLPYTGSKLNEKAMRQFGVEDESELNKALDEYLTLDELGTCINKLAASGLFD